MRGGTWCRLQNNRIGEGFRTIALTAKAAKLRLMRDLGPKEIHLKAESIRVAQLDSIRRPFGKWHQNAYAKTLRENWVSCKQHGVRINAAASNSQKASRAILVQKLCPFDIEERIRSKVKRWLFKDPPRHVAMRLARNFGALKGKLPPAVISSFFRALWNGIPTSRRMATCPDFKQVPCVFKCSSAAADSLEHYCRCPKLQEAFEPLTQYRCRDLDDFFGTAKGESEQDRLECARRVRVTCRAVQLARSGQYDSIIEIVHLEWNRTFL